MNTCFAWRARISRRNQFLNVISLSDYFHCLERQVKINLSTISLLKNLANSNNMNSVQLSSIDAFNKHHITIDVDRKNCITTMTNTKTSASNVKKADTAANIIKNSNIVCFDVDSTVIREEGIDELAEFCGKGSEVSRVTKEAMGGAMTFQDALKVRLSIINPTKQQVDEFIKLRPSTLTKGVKVFINNLKQAGKQVFLISGGFDCLIEPVATDLGIPMSNVFANKLCFRENGEFNDFDRTQPTSRSGGKSVAVGIIKSKNQSAVITMIGDGATDLEAVPPADFFIGFGGNVLRTEVFNRADYFITDFDQLW